MSFSTGAGSGVGATFSNDLHNTVEGFSVSHAEILDGSTSANSTVLTGASPTALDIYGVRSASITPDIGNFDNTGDDFTLSTWYWINFATIAIEGGFIPFEMVAMLQEDDISYSAGSDQYCMPIWTECSVNVRPRPMRVSVPAKDALGNLRTIDFVLFRVHFAPISFTGPAYKGGLTVNYAGKAVLSPVDETGAALTEKAIGRLCHRTGTCP